MADLYYYEAGYVDENYFGYIADAQVDIGPYIVEGWMEPGYWDDYSAQSSLTCIGDVTRGEEVPANGAWSSSASMSITANKTVSAATSMSVVFTQTAYGARERDIDMFAFTEGQLLSAVQAIREYALDADAAFDIATDYVRYRSTAVDVNSEFSQSVINERSRATSMETQAAFSLSIDIDDLTKDASASLSSTASVSTNGGKLQNGNATLSAYSSIFVSRNAYNRTPIVIDGYPVISGDFKKYGSYSNRINTTATKTLSYPNQIRAYITNQFVVQGWYLGGYTGPGTILFCGAGTGISETSVGANQWAVYMTVRTVNLNGYYTFHLLTKNSSGQTVKFSSTEYSVDQLPYIRNIYTNSISGSSFNLFAVTKDSNNVISFYINDTQVVSGTISSLGTATEYRIGWLASKSPSYAYWDELSYRKNTSSIDTNALTNDVNNQVFLFHFEEIDTFIPIDDNSTPVITHSGNAALASVVEISATLNGVQNYQSVISSSFTQTATISHIEGADLTAFSNASLSANVEKLKIADSLISSETALSADGNAVRDAVSSLESQSDLTSTALRIQPGAAVFESTASQLIAVVRLAGLFIDDQVISTLAVDPVVVRSGQSQNTSEFSQSVDAYRVRFNSADISSSSSASADADVRITTSAELTSSFSQSTINSRTRDFSSNQTSTTSVYVLANNLGKIECIAFNSAAMTVDAVKITSAESIETADTALVANNVRIRSTSSTLSSEFTETATIKKTSTVQANLTAFASELVVGVKTARISIGQSSVATLSITAKKTVKGVVQVNSSFTETATIKKLARVGSTLSCTASLTANGIFVSQARAALSALAFEVTAVVKIASSLADLESTATMSAAVSIIRSAAITTSAQFTETVSAQRVIKTSAALTGQFSETAVIGKLAVGSANITSAMTFTAGVREIFIDEIVYVIPAEIWEYEIGSETREYTIGSETREYIIT